MFGFAFDLLWRWLVTTLAILMVPSLVKSVHIEGLSTALAAAAILGVLNVLLRPVLVLLTLPLTFLSFGFFLLFINAFLFEVAGALVSGMQVESFWGAFLASLIISIVSWVLSLRWPWDRRSGPEVWVFRRGGQSQGRPVWYDANPRGGIKGPGSKGTVELNKNDDGTWK